MGVHLPLPEACGPPWGRRQARGTASPRRDGRSSPTCQAEPPMGCPPRNPRSFLSLPTPSRAVRKLSHAPTSGLSVLMHPSCASCSGPYHPENPGLKATVTAGLPAPNHSVFCVGAQGHNPGGGEGGQFMEEIKLKRLCLLGLQDHVWLGVCASDVNSWYDGRLACSWASPREGTPGIRDKAQRRGERAERPRGSLLCSWTVGESHPAPEPDHTAGPPRTDGSLHRWWWLSEYPFHSRGG